MKSNSIPFAAFGVSAASTFTASAALVFSDFSDITINGSADGGDGETLYFDLETVTFSSILSAEADFGFTAEIILTGAPDLIQVFALSSDYKILAQENGGEFGFTYHALRFEAGQVIGGESGGLGSSTMLDLDQDDLNPGANSAYISGFGGETDGSTVPVNNFFEGDTGYLGLVKYELGGESGFSLEQRIGFVEIEIGSLTVKSAGFETDPVGGGSVTVIPEASNISLLALGLGGVVGYRRRRVANA